MPTRAAAARTSSPRRTSARCRRSIAAASLLIDYVLTVAVSIAAGVAAITSALPHWRLDPVWSVFGFVAILMVGNLRGIREAGRVFAGPTYLFIVGILAMIAVGAWRYVTGTLRTLPPTEHRCRPARRRCRCSCC